MAGLDGLMSFISSHWRFNGQNYQGFDELNERQKNLFPLRHSVLHLMKSVGKMAAEAEKADHGNEVDKEMLRVSTAKLLASTLNLAVHLGMTEQSLVATIELEIETEIAEATAASYVEDFDRALQK